MTISVLLDLETPGQMQKKAKKIELKDTAEPDHKSESPDWVQGETDNGQIYYYCRTTGGRFLLKPYVLLHTVLLKQANSCSDHF